MMMAGGSVTSSGSGSADFVRRMVDVVASKPSFSSPLAPQQDGSSSPLCTPVFLGHGVDDAYVDVELGRQAVRVLTRIGFDTEWREYSGADQEGHWLKMPEEMDDIVDFISRKLVCRIG